MRIAYLDCFSGISGDMFLGALVDAGVPAQLLEETVAALDLGARLEVSRVVRGGIAATKVDVYAHGEKDMPREDFWEQREREHSSGHSHEHEHASEHEHSHSHPHNHEHHAEQHSHGRGLNEIRQIIGKASISATAKATAIRIFEALGAAEARSTIPPSSRCTFTKLAPSMPWSILSVLPWEPRLWVLMNGYALR